MTRRFALALVAAVLAAAAAAGLAFQEAPTAGPRPEVRAHLQALVDAFNSGSPERWEAMVQEHFTAEYRARGSADERHRLYQRMRADLGTISLGEVTREGPDAPIRVAVRGSTGASGRLELGLERSSPFRIAVMGVRLGDGGEDASTLPPPPVRGDMSPDELTRTLDGYLAGLAARDVVSGVALVAREGRTVFAKAYGLADRANRVPNTVDTRFNLGSINKTFTQAAIAQLVAKGRLRYEDTLGRWIPDYPQEATRAATVEQLLGHAAGVANFFGEEFSRASKDLFRSNADYYRFVSGQKPRFAPGERKEYCNGCYIVLGAVIERASGMPYERYVADNIFAPAGMKDTGYPQSDGVEPRIAMGYTRRAGDGVLRSNIHLRGATGSAAGGGFSTAADLLAYDNMLRAGRLLDAAGMSRILDSTEPGQPGARAGGTLGIAGGAPGTNAVLDSDGRWTVVVLTNMDPPTGEDLGVALMKALTSSSVR